ncbi:MAG: matrixin family metalloprotease [Actinobacteria bacterium]|nr:matrixin family metalloprotease [Actinomycetota bacterium]
MATTSSTDFGQLDPTDGRLRSTTDRTMVSFARGYLERYGYTRACGCDAGTVCPHTQRALERMQTFLGLVVTGTVTLETLELMRQPRCPMPDVDPDEAGGPGINEQDPFVFTDRTWTDRSLRWFLDTGTPDTIGEAAAIQRAFDTWAAQVPLTFTRTFAVDDADFVVDWVVGDHGDGSPFDGVGSVLAHAFHPRDGRIHFDESDLWGHTESGSTHDVETVALHEIGHALGLRHSGSSDAAMFPTINDRQRTPHKFDIRGMRSRYPVVVHRHTSDAATVPIWALRNSGGTGVVTVDLGRTVRVLAWGQVTMTDSLTDLDRDNAYAIEVFAVDGERTHPLISGGRHWGSAQAPSNVHAGAYVGRASTVTFRLSALHTADLDLFGVGTVIVLEEE